MTEYIVRKIGSGVEHREEIIRCKECLSWKSLLSDDKLKPTKYGCCKVYNNAVTPFDGFCFLGKKESVFGEVQKR